MSKFWIGFEQVFNGAALGNLAGGFLIFTVLVVVFFGVACLLIEKPWKRSK